MKSFKRARQGYSYQDKPCKKVADWEKVAARLKPDLKLSRTEMKMKFSEWTGLWTWNCFEAGTIWEANA